MDIIIDHYNKSHFNDILTDVARKLTKIENPKEGLYAKLHPSDSENHSACYEIGCDGQLDYYLRIYSDGNYVATLSTTEPDDFLKIVSSVNLNEDGDYL